MSASHREERRGDRLLDVLTDDEAGVRLVVSRLGAELISVARRDRSGEWRGFLWRDNEVTAPAKGWANHATVMGYYLHRLKNERTSYRGHEIRGGTHSFLRHKTWRLQEAGANSLTYRITPDDYDSSEYPYRVSLDLSYTIERNALAVQFAFANHEDESVHVEFGLHPGFACTYPASFRAQRSEVEEPRGSRVEQDPTGSLDSARDDGQAFGLEMPRGLYRRWFSPDNYLSGETEEIHFNGGEMPFDRAKLSGSYILEFVDVPDRRFTFSDPPSNRSVAIDMAEAPYVTLWSDGNPFLCIEPCWGLTDSHDQRAFEEKLGIQIIPPRGRLVRSFTISPRLT